MAFAQIIARFQLRLPESQATELVDAHMYVVWPSTYKSNIIL
jgi:hypothetical protein